MKTVLILISLCFYQPVQALIIATGTPEGTYYQIAQDIERVAERDGIPIELIQTNGSFENINLLGSGKVDLAILQVDALKFAADTLQLKAGINVLEQVKVVLNLFPEEIHVIAKDNSIRSLDQLNGKRVAVGPENSGSALTAEVLLTLYGVRAERSFDGPAEALKKLQSGDLDALIFVGGAPVPAFEKLDQSFHFVRLPANALMEQIYQKRKIEATVYPWAGETETYTVPSVIMTRDRRDEVYAAVIQKLLLAIFSNKEKLDASGHPKWKTSLIRYFHDAAGYQPAIEIIQIYNLIDLLGYRIIKK
jgi:TRAP transporter TAXI family solute receptor